MTLSEYHIDKPLDRRSNHKAQCVFVIVFWERSNSDYVYINILTVFLFQLSDVLIATKLS